MSRSAKKVLEAGYKLIESWAAQPNPNIVPLIDALKEYDQDRFFTAMKKGMDELTAGVATSKYNKEKRND